MLKHLTAAATLAFCALCTAQPLTTGFTFQGELNNGSAVANGTYDFRFALFDSPVGGVQVGPQLCSDNIAVVNGKLTVQLDFGAQFAGQQRFLEVQVRQDTGLTCSNPTGFVTLAPRQKLSAAPNAVYSLNAGIAASAATATNATQLSGQPASFYTNATNLTGTLPPAALSGTYSAALTLTNINNTFAGSGAGLTSLNATSLATGTLDPARLPVPLSLSGNAPISVLGATNSSSSSATAAVLGHTTSTTGFTNGLYGQSDSTGGNGVYGVANATSGQAWGVYGITSSVDGLGGYFTGPGDGLWGVTSGTGKSGTLGFNYGDGVGVYGQANGTASTGVFGRVYTTTGTSTGGLFVSYADAGTGASGYAYSPTGSTLGLYGESDSTSGTGVKGVALASTGNTNGVYAQTNSASGYAVRALSASTTGVNYGVYAQTNSANGYAVFGEATGTTSNCYGGYFDCQSQSGVGAYGTNSSTSGAGVGVVGASSGPSGIGVQGWGLATSGANYGGYFRTSSTGGRGVYGYATATTGQTYGVLGQATANGWAVFAQGDLGASGLKPFRIDHPQDPENKYLLHYCAEGPDPLNVYTGKVTLNQQGEATIDLPPYFASINKDPRYTLTPIGAAMPLLHIAQEVDEVLLTQAGAAAPGDPIPAVSFTIAGGAPNAKVSWEVKAVRNDRWVQKNGAPVEVEKQGAEKGTYQHPDLYNQPPEKGLGYRATLRNAPDAPKPSAQEAATVSGPAN